MENNIFETAGKQAQSQKNKTSREMPRQNKGKKIEPTINSELQEMLEKMRIMKEDLEQQLSAIYEKGKESKVNVSLLIEKAKNLTAQQMDKMEEQQRILKEKILATTSPGSCLMKNPKTKEKITQERKGKLRGARNNWIYVK